IYSGTTLGNSEDEILLLRPDGSEADRVLWGGASALRISRGKSLERTGFVLSDWVTATTVWSNSAGDFGTPGSAYGPGPTPTITPTPTATPTVTPTPIPLPAQWQPGVTPSPLQIDEVNFLGSDTEFVVLRNVGETELPLAGWTIGDAQTPGGREGLYALPDEAILPPGALYAIARNGAAFHIRWGRAPDAQFESSPSAAPVLARRRDLASGALALNDSGDEVVLLDPSLGLADALAYEDGDRASLGLTGVLYPIADYSLQRVPGFAFPAEREQRRRFLLAAPAPFASVDLPASAPLSNPALADGMQAAWGTLGAVSNFTPGGTAPPHYVAAAAASIGLDFVAIADTVEGGARMGESALGAWRWQGSDGNRAVVYGPVFGTDGAIDSFLAGLASHDALAQWTASTTPSSSAGQIVALAADNLAIPSGLPALSKKWQDAPYLPAGNAQPPVAGASAPNPRYTGLAVEGETEAALRAALAARRGWLTNRPGLALTLQAHTATDGVVWMGSTVAPHNALLVDVIYHDLSAEVASLAIWQNDRPLAQSDLPQANGVWQVTVSALPGSVLFAVATQADGDFAVTAPLLVENGEGAVVVLNEVLPAPAADLNGDGSIDSNDEFIELYNPGSSPVSLARWRLEDRSNTDPTRRRFNLGVAHIVPAGGFLTIWGNESHIGLNNDSDRVALYDSNDRLVDSVEWNARIERGQGLSRVPDGGNWQTRAPSPGGSNPNDAPGSGGGGGESESLPPWGSGAAPGTPGGEAVGPFRSVTAAKLAGMEDVVHFVGVVTVPPGLFNSAIYVADPALPPNDKTAWLGVQVYLRRGDFPELGEGDRVDVRGTMHSFRGEREIVVERPEDIWRVGAGEPLQPLPIAASAVGESLEGRLVTFGGFVAGWLGVSIFLGDPDNPDVEPVMVTVRSSLGWRRPFVNKGERWRVTGIVSQSAAAAPWNGGYRVLVRYPSDLVEIAGR
ncbi:MAG: lamin tail domain-containing protein, partial [Chloroflexi bacterium]|nr:lamin tail domain-containing protein [Chloroflexota bacterium]